MIKVTRTFNYEYNYQEINNLLRLARSVWRRDTLLKAGKAEMRIFHAHTLLLNPAINEARTCEAFRKAIHEAVDMLRRDAKDAIEADHAEALEMNATINAEKSIRSELPPAHAEQVMFYAANDHAARRNIVEEAHAEALEDDLSYQNAIQCVADNLSLPVWEGCCETVKRQIIKTHHTEALIMNSEYQTRTGQGISHNTKAHSAPLSLLGNGLLEGGVRSLVVPS